MKLFFFNPVMFRTWLTSCIIMRLNSSMLLILLASIQVSASSYGQNISIKEKDASLYEIIQKLQSQTGYSFVYNSEKVKTVKTSIDVENLSLEQTLAVLFRNLSFSYKILKKNVLIKEDKSKVVKLSQNQMLFTSMALSQARVSGTVTDDKGEPVPGVSVRLKNTSTGTATDTDGRYTIQVPDLQGTLNFTSIGFASQDVHINGQAEINVSLVPETSALSEVVVTALGIMREEKSLGYAVSEVQGEDISNTAPNNWLNGLAGKVPGLQMTSAGTGPGGSLRVVLRGQNSLDLSKGEALFVIDGVPITSGMAGNGSSAYNPSGEPSMDYGNSASEVNPDDIESVTVLRGPAATALYGSRAGAGAIVITTKSGANKGKVSVTVNSNFALDNVLNWPDYQYEYGEGQRNLGAHTYYSYGGSPDGPNTRSTHTWGPRFEGQLFYQYDPVTQQQGAVRTPWVADKNYVKGFFNTGATATNSITVNGGTAQNNFRFSYTDLRNKYIVPNTGFSRNTLALSTSHKFNKLQVNAKVNYYKKASDNLPAAGYSAKSVAYSLLWTAPSIPIEWYRNYWMNGQENIAQNSFYNGGDDNIYMKVYEQLNSMNKNRVFGNLSATYEFNSKLNLTIRSGIDSEDDIRSTRRPFSSVNSISGMYREQQTNSLEMNNDFLFKYDTHINNDWRLAVSAGGNNMTRTWRNDNSLAERLNFPGLYNLSNSRDRVFATNRNYKKVVNSLYGLAQFDFKSKIYVDITGRNDWSSTLPAGNNSYFYPSLSTSFVLSEIFDFSPFRALSFAKLRASIAQVGNDTDPYQTAKYYSANEIGGSYTNPTVLPNLELKPEMITSRELGLDVRFFTGRLGFDVTYYNSNSKNQILEVPADPSTGYFYRAFNAGLVNNSGWEVGMNAQPVKRTNGLNWNLGLTWSKNTNKVIELADGVESIILSRGPRGFVQASVGGTLGDIYGGGLLRNSDGQIIYDASGYPRLDLNLKYLGSSIPDWRGSINNQFTYKNWGLSFLWDGSVGGKIYSLTHSMLAYSGKLEKTLPGRYNGLIGEGVQVNPDGTYRPNDVVTDEISLYYNALYQRDNAEMNTFDSSFLKLREARLEFRLPSRLLSKIKYLQSGTIGVFGHDLLLFTKFPAFDPEIATLNDGRIEPGFETGQLPSTRTFGANIKLSF